MQALLIVRHLTCVENVITSTIVPTISTCFRPTLSPKWERLRHEIALGQAYCWHGVAQRMGALQSSV